MILRIADYLRRLGKEDEGFTLIELLVVVAILGVLAAIAVPAVTGAIDDARRSADEANVKIINDALQRYYFDKGEYPADYAAGTTPLATNLVPNYLDAVPESPWPNLTDTYEMKYAGGKVTVINPATN